MKVRVVIPEGVIGVKPMPKPGWTISTIRGPYAQSYPFYHGTTLTEGVKEVIWSGNLPDTFFDEFVFAAFLSDTLPTGKMLYFPTYQECENGAYAWVETPSSSQDARTLSVPAPGVMILEATKKVAVRTHTLGAMVVEAPWARATQGGVEVAGGYMKITNNGQHSDRLLNGTLEAAKDVEIHEMSMTEGIMRMRRLDGGLEIRPGESVELRPGGYHVMFTGLKSTLVQGQSVAGTLVFEKAGSMAVQFDIAPIGAQSGGDHHRHH